MEGGGTLELKANYASSEAEHITTIYNKDLNAFFTSDFGYNAVHLWMGTGVTKHHINNWKAQLVKFKNELTELNPVIYPGHGDPCDVKLFDKMIQYIDNFNQIIATAKSKEEVTKKMMTLYPDYREADFLLKYSVENHFK